MFPPSPEQLRLKLLVPGVFIVTTSDPFTLLLPDHDPEAEQLFALDDDHVIVTELSICTSLVEVEIFIVGAGVDPPLPISLRLIPPPPPPPPHELMRKRPKVNMITLLLKKFIKVFWDAIKE